jgi:hypothetical protein
MSNKKAKNYSFIHVLRKDKRINENFLNILSSLSLEEVIALKLELSIKLINNKLYNFPLWSSMPNITRDALLRYAMSACQSKRDMARFLGIPINKFNEILRKYNTEKLFNKNE